jgi:hypothetical protein
VGAPMVRSSIESSMGSAGHAFIAHTKALSPPAQCKDGGYGLPPHPRSARAGQRYWPRADRVRDVLVVRRIDGDRVVVTGVEDRVRRSLAVRRLLALRDDGQGRYYQFQGFLSRRYQTLVNVRTFVDDEVILRLPEWHPERDVHLPKRLLPAGSQYPGAWLTAFCDLSASSAARLQLADFEAARRSLPTDQPHSAP